MAVDTVPQQIVELDPPDSPPLRITVLFLWFTDMVAATLFFVVPYATELNPITVLFFNIFGLAGVPLAAALYALLIVFIGHILSDPYDIQFTLAVASLYTLLVINNILLLLLGEPLLALIA
ncbi:hypothetical protein [Natrialba taiwanensis]|uniref:Uncharacterized protein n=1 Tax=Natrialba taiwanensis DSM 12281 TaxID=1230458 RepID=M0ABG6_9EURY|nr:hypothetical protein [Natrialba taiwanensis]ELY96075.1 hypothetical protein C484_02249 [Natrialba taiwanensis DSM 12281]